MIDIRQILDYAREKNATDIHISAGSPVLFRLGRDLIPATQGRLTEQMSQDLSFALLSEDQQQQLSERLDFDLMVADGDYRYRVNIGYFHGHVGAIIRILPEHPGTIDELFLPDIVRHLANKTKGLILITGSTSQGKTTTLASMIDEINTTSKKHLVTIEDPIEYVHDNKTSIVRQREVGKDTRTFA